jgi:hypothetical protein
MTIDLTHLYFPVWFIAGALFCLPVWLERRKDPEAEGGYEITTKGVVIGTILAGGP